MSILKNENLEVRADWNGAQWIIRELGCPESAGVRVEALVMRAFRTGKDFVEGTITSIHGLDQEVARHLGMADLKLLGVGSQFRSQRLIQRPNGTRKVTLTQEGRIFGNES